MSDRADRRIKEEEAHWDDTWAGRSSRGQGSKETGAGSLKEKRIESHGLRALRAAVTCSALEVAERELQLEEARQKLEEDQERLLRAMSSGQHEDQAAKQRTAFESPPVSVRPRLAIPTGITPPKVRQSPVIRTVGGDTGEPSTRNGDAFQGAGFKRKLDKTIPETEDSLPSRNGTIDASAPGSRRDHGDHRDQRWRSLSNENRHMPEQVRLPPPPSADIVPLIRSQSSPAPPVIQQPIYVASTHKRKLRTLVLNPANPHQCATSSLDTLVQFWKIGSRGQDLSRRFFVDCMTPQRHWPEDIAWHPSGNSLLAVYTADKKDPQVGVIKNSETQKGERKAKFVENTPHDKGTINSISFMPWEGPTRFATGGSDHAVVLWSERGGSSSDLEAKVLHRKVHSSAVLGVAGMRSKHVIVSVGADKRVIGFDVPHESYLFNHMLESKATCILPNPRDSHLFLVQTGTLGRQLRLFDTRAPKTELHALGWQQQSSESQSALISPSWSPEGLLIAAGSVDPKIHIFDIRFNGRDPALSLCVHTKRVLKAAWHQSLPLILSISSDLNIGIHGVR